MNFHESFYGEFVTTNNFDGHYEKVEEKHVKYFYVPNLTPSGLPGAFAVSEAEAKNIKDPKRNLYYRNESEMYKTKFNDEDV